MNILFLDDDNNRTRLARQWFMKHNLLTAETAEEAKEILISNPRFDLAMLDHDLGGKVYCPSDENSGYDVALFISLMNREFMPKQVIVHSFNPTGARKMVSVLSDADIPVEHIPFGRNPIHPNNYQ